MSRPKIPREVETELLLRSRRCCAFCFGLHLANTPVKGQIAHIDRDPANNTLRNLAWLCLNHHDEYDSRPSQSKGLTQNELIAYRDNLYAFNDAARASIEPLSRVQRLSPEGLSLAGYLNQRSVAGKKLDPQIRLETLVGGVGLTSDEVELAIDELVRFGLVEIGGSRDTLYVMNRLFWETDPLFAENDPVIDAQTVARALVNRQENGADMLQMSTELQWPPRRLNPAASYLVEMGHAEGWATINSAPFWVYRIVRTIATKRFVRDLDRSQNL